MRKSIGILFAIIIFVGASWTCAASGESILAAHVNTPGKMEKSRNASYSAIIQTGLDAQTLENLTYRGFTVLLNALTDGTYEVQAYKMVQYGNRRVNSIFSSVYKSSVEYGYTFDSNQQRIVQYHFLFPPNSLTGWADPGDSVSMQHFDWGELFPTRNCSLHTPVHTLEETGREYLEAACLPDRDTALRFAQKFIDYMQGPRGLQ